MNRDITLCAWCYTSLYLVGGHDARRGAYDHERLRRIHDSAKETADLEEREVAATRAELTWVCGAPYSFFSKPLGLPAARNNKRKLRTSRPWRICSAHVYPCKCSVRRTFQSLRSSTRRSRRCARVGRGRKGCVVEQSAGGGSG